MRIVITGTPGTGKTSVALVLGKKLGLPVIQINEYVKEHELILEKENDTLIVDMEKLKSGLEKEDGIIEGHLACEFLLSRARVIVLRCDPEILKKRYQNKGYGREKIQDNLECEALDYCTVLAEDHYGAENVFEINASKLSIDEVSQACENIIKGVRKSDHVDFSEYLLG